MVSVFLHLKSLWISVNFLNFVSPDEDFSCSLMRILVFQPVKSMRFFFISVYLLLAWRNLN